MNKSEEQVDTTQIKILLVDDEVEVRLPLTRSLSLLGFYADHAGSGQEGLDKLKQGRHNVMVLDLWMPGMDGVETMHRALDIDPNLIVIILTGHATLNSAIAAVKAGAADYLCKPVSIHDLADAISKALKKRDREMDSTFSSPASVPAWSDGTLKCGPVILNKEALWVAVDALGNGSHVQITTSEARVLAYLMSNPNQILTSWTV